MELLTSGREATADAESGNNGYAHSNGDDRHGCGICQPAEKDPAFNELGFEERLGLPVNAEWNRRQSNKLNRFIRNAHFAVSSATGKGIRIPRRPQAG